MTIFNLIKNISDLFYFFFSIIYFKIFNKNSKKSYYIFLKLYILYGHKINKIVRVDQVDKLYYEVLEALAIPEKNRKLMISSQTFEAKWKLIEQHAALLSHDEDVSDAEDWAALLTNETNYPT